MFELTRVYAALVGAALGTSGFAPVAVANPTDAYFEVFKANWAWFVEDCSAVYKDLDRFIDDHRQDAHFRLKTSEDGTAIAFHLGEGETNYLSVFADRLEGGSAITCEHYHDGYETFKAEDLAAVAMPWLRDTHGLMFGGGFVPLYNESTRQYGVIDAFDGLDQPVRVRFFNGAMQFLSERYVK